MFVLCHVRLTRWFLLEPVVLVSGLLTFLWAQAHDR
jgi:hypothetical protein